MRVELPCDVTDAQGRWCELAHGHAQPHSFQAAERPPEQHKKPDRVWLWRVRHGATDCGYNPEYEEWSEEPDAHPLECFVGEYVPAGLESTAFWNALAEARVAYSTGGIEGASSWLKRMFDEYDARSPAGVAERRDPEPQEIAEACALVCESRSASLFHDSHRLNESNEAGKCAAAIRFGWQRMLQHVRGTGAEPTDGEEVARRRLCEAIQALRGRGIVGRTEIDLVDQRINELAGALRAGGPPEEEK